MPATAKESDIASVPVSDTLAALHVNAETEGSRTPRWTSAGRSTATRKKERPRLRSHLVADVIDRVPQLGPKAANAKQPIRNKLIEHKQYIAKHGEDMPEIRN
jgi:phosphoketolase